MKHDLTMKRRCICVVFVLMVTVGISFITVTQFGAKNEETRTDERDVAGGDRYKRDTNNTEDEATSSVTSELENITTPSSDVTAPTPTVPISETITDPTTTPSDDSTTLNDDTTTDDTTIITTDTQPSENTTLSDTLNDNTTTVTIDDATSLVTETVTVATTVVSDVVVTDKNTTEQNETIADGSVTMETTTVDDAAGDNTTITPDGATATTGGSTEAGTTIEDFCVTDPCQNEGLCELVDSGKRCNCTVDYTGESCQTAVNWCEGDPCEQGGTCINISGGYNCTCPQGYGGNNCSIDTDLCDPDWCQNGATCVQNQTSYSCTCTEAYTGTLCTEEVDFCVSSPCQNEGTCQKLTGGYNCQCMAGYNGTHCENDIDDCVGITCENGGSCLDGINTYSCACAAGWQGTSCESDIDECISPPGGERVCDVNAECVNTVGAFNCTCKSSYTGDGINCNFMDSCASSPCLHGMCYSEMTSFTCTCFSGWQGDLCDQDIDECGEAAASLDCDVDYGVCENTIGSYTCSCKEEARGDGYKCVRDVMYPYSNVIADLGDDKIFSEYVLGGISFFGSIYWNIYISINGYITLGSRYDRSSPWTDADTTDVKMIAPYWTDLDLGNGGSGKLYYDSYDMSKPENDTSEMFALIKGENVYGSTPTPDFDPTYVGVITWHQVSPYPAVQYRKQNVTFQCVLATDSKRSFVMFNYDRDRIFIDRTSNNWTIRSLLSYGSDDNQLINAPISDQFRPDIGSNRGDAYLGRYILPLAVLSSEVVENYNTDCLKWYYDQNDDIIDADALLVEPCPCTRTQARLDLRYTKDVNESDCYKARFSGNVWNLCCYDSEMALLPSSGGSELVYEAHRETDRAVCCSTQVPLCHLYHEKRPADTCVRYRPPAWASAWGVGHFQTFDDRMYSYAGTGEYVLVGSGDFMLQGRIEPNSENENATSFTAFAAQQGNFSKVELRIDAINRDDINIRIDGEKKSTLIGLEQASNYSGVIISRIPGQNQLNIQHQNGFGYFVGLAHKSVWIRVTVPEAVSVSDSTTGLLGTLDGNPGNDLLYRNDSTVLPSAAHEDQIHQFGQTWMVEEAESLFTYDLDGGKTYAVFNSPDFIPMQYDDLLANISLVSGINTSLAETTCGESITCLMDYIATGNVEQAKWAESQRTENINYGKNISYMPPLFRTGMPGMVDVTVGQMMALTLVATSQGSSNEDILFKVVTNLDAAAYTLDGNIFEWVPSTSVGVDPESVSLRFYAMSSQGATALYWPVLDFCGCLSGDCIRKTRNLENVYSPDEFYAGVCVCGLGTSGKHCEVPGDICEPDPCYTNVTCTATPDSTLGFQCADCPAGLLGDGIKCYDDNECLTLEQPCSHFCTNQRGSYLCTCQEGYVLQEDGSTCLDIDECTGRDGEVAHTCTAMGEYCINTPGSYKCSCKSRYYREADKCVEAPKRFGGQMTFKFLKASGKVVTYDAEMSDADSEMFKLVANSVEEIVSIPYKAKYPTFKKAQVYDIRNGSTMAMFDLFFADGATMNSSELDTTLHDYLATSGCVSDGPDCTVGTLIGVDMDKSRAMDKDLCIVDRDNDCDVMSTECTTLSGQFFCQCRSGYKQWLDFTNICQDEDECTQGTHSCDNETSTCENIHGSYECRCRFGYKQLNGTCVDACEPNPCENEGVCLPMESGYICQCVGLWDGLTCTDENKEAIRMRNIAIAVGAAIGAVCLVLFIILIICCVRQKKKKYTYSCRPITEDKYHGTSGNVDNWGNTGTVPIRSRPKPEYEMRENGSGDSLMDDNIHRPSRPSSTTAFGSGPGHQGVENPAYSHTGETGKTRGQANVSGEYF